MLRALVKATRTHRRDRDGHISATEQDTPPAARLETGPRWAQLQQMWEDKVCGCTRPLQTPSCPKGQERNTGME